MELARGPFATYFTATVTETERLEVALVALDSQPFRATLLAPYLLFLYSERDNRSLFCCHANATNATPRASGLGMGNGGGISDCSNATLYATECYQLLPGRSLMPLSISCRIRLVTQLDDGAVTALALVGGDTV